MTMTWGIKGQSRDRQTQHCSISATVL